MYLHYIHTYVHIYINWLYLVGCLAAQETGPLPLTSRNNTQWSMLRVENKANVWLGCHTMPSLPVFFIQEYKTSDSTAITSGRLKVLPSYNTVEMVTLTGALLTSTFYLHYIRSLMSGKVLVKSEHYSWHQHCVWKPYNRDNEFRGGKSFAI
jgi:hypothetical protein